MAALRRPSAWRGEAIFFRAHGNGTQTLDRESHEQHGDNWNQSDFCQFPLVSAGNHDPAL
jgi:hypothetical protein